jgi:hypothetical protein
MKFRFRRKDRAVASPTGETGTVASHQAQPKPSPTDRVPNDVPDSARYGESGFGIKVLVPGEVPSVE